jgi:hypothetical protein
MTTFGLPGTWLEHVDLVGDAEPTEPHSRCGCHVPLVWDGKRGYWRHLTDGTACGGLNSQRPVTSATTRRTI